MRNFVLVSSLLALGACAEAPTAVEQAKADFGRPIPQAECQRLAEASIKSNLKDPYSARFKHGKCNKQALHSIPIAGLPKQYGYVILSQVNSKNGFGAYTGYQTWLTAVNNGQVIRRQYPHEGVLLPY